MILIILMRLPEDQKDEFSHDIEKMLFFVLINLNILCLSSMIVTKALLFPSLNIATITTAAISQFNNNFMAFMITISKTIHTLNASMISGAIETLSNLIG